MRAVILAAGRGRRLSDVIGDRPKCLARIGERTLIERQIRSLRGCGVDAITVVAGFEPDLVRRACGPGVDVVVNSRFDATNSLYSLWLAREQFTEGLVVMNCDVLFHDQLLCDLLTSRDPDALLVATRRGEHYSDEEMKVRARRGCVDAIAKTLADDEADGENVGVAKFGADGARLLVEVMQEVLDGGGAREWLPRAFGEFARRRPLRIVETRGYPWIEIDFPEDYWRACTEVLPSITDGDRLDARSRVEAAQAGVVARRSGRTAHHV
jgi:L-glutamine-phosphate cytidylyltransferase